MNISETNLTFKAFADETRMRMLHILTAGELCVCDIMSILNLPQSKVSRHLAYLRKCGFVKVRKNGLWVFYSLKKPRNKIQESMLSCVKSCFNTVPTLKRDLNKAKETVKSKECTV
ncbi:MAG TPA: metalloregulator ArsR/SmtB family transcription factor [Nitrospinota bacterium]|jgi:ArsR family transcriptional regulator|nr:metalloregulator ArsR/SmtB family transcription factor [Nitrospinota bacterium]